MSVGLGSQLGSYRLESLVGGSGSSFVYRARHVRLDTRAAVRVLSRELGSDEAFTERFLREVHVAAGLEHPNVIPVYDTGVEQGRPYVAMRYVSGGGLKRLLDRRGRVEADRVFSLLGSVAEALDAAHSQGLVHGGVRPGAILLQWSREGALENVFLSDFGIHSSQRDGVPQADRLADRFDYLAPEQIEGSEISPWTDVFSLGCVLYHLLTGRVPFAGAERRRVAPPSEVRDGLPRAVDRPVLRALAVDPMQRFTTCGALMEEFQGVADVEIVHDRDTPEWRPALPDSPPALVVEAPSEEEAPGEAPAEPDAEAVPDPPQRARERGPRFSPRTALVAACTLAAVALGYVGWHLTEGDGNGGKRLSPAAIRALAAKDPLRGIAAGGLPEFRCAFTRAPPGGAVLENASCAPRKAGAPPIERVTLALFPTRRALDGLYERAQALTPGARLGGECRPDRPWGGNGLWFGGRMFCLVASGGSAAAGASIVWTVNDSVVLGEARASKSADLGAFWLRRRLLRNPLR